MVVSDGRRSGVLQVKWAWRSHERGADRRGEASQHRIEQIASERVGVFAGREPLCQADGGGAEHADPADVQSGRGIQLFRELPPFDAGLDVGFRCGRHVLEEFEPLEVLPKAWDGAVDEHQPEILGVQLGELVERPESPAQPVERIRDPLDCAQQMTGQAAKSLFGEREEDVVLAREVPVDGGRAVLDSLGNLANRDVLVSLVDEQLARRVEDGAPNGFAVALLSFFDAHLASRECLPIRV